MILKIEGGVLREEPGGWLFSYYSNDTKREPIY